MKAARDAVRASRFRRIRYREFEILPVRQLSVVVTVSPAVVFRLKCLEIPTFRPGGIPAEATSLSGNKIDEAMRPARQPDVAEQAVVQCLRRVARLPNRASRHIARLALDIRADDVGEHLGRDGRTAAGRHHRPGSAPRDPAPRMSACIKVRRHEPGHRPGCDIWPLRPAYRFEIYPVDTHRTPSARSSAPYGRQDPLPRRADRGR